MLTINPSSLRATLGDGAAPAATSGDPSDPAGFSSLLRQSQVSSAAPRAGMPPAVAAHADNTAPRPAVEAKTDAPAASEHEKAEATDEPASNDPTSRTRALLKGRPRAAETAPHATTQADATPPSAKTDAAAGAEANPADAAKATTASPIDPAIAHWLAALQRPAAEAKPDTQSDKTTAASDATTTDGGSALRPAADAKADATDAKPRGAHLPACEATPTAFSATLAEQTRAEPAASASGTASVNAAAAAGAAGASPAAANTVHDTASPVAVPIPTPIDSPDFAQVLGVQLSVLAKDGIQQAELHLNPADMGPVSVQIVMDGTQARVDFGADVAATRHAIEAGLPELASALRDAGFTLAGGGVSQHAGGRREGQSDSGDSPRRSARAVSNDTVSRVATAARRIVTQGGVDLYA